jgi:hypothetical protein
MMNAQLHMGPDGPVDRLVEIVVGMQALKESGAAVGADHLMQMSSYVPPTVFGVAARLLVRTRAINLTITNVPGPQFPLYCMGAKVEQAFPYVGIVEGQALTIAVLSYDGVLGFGITGDREVLPDIDVLVEGIAAGFGELQVAYGLAEPPEASSEPDQEVTARAWASSPGSRSPSWRAVCGAASARPSSCSTWPSIASPPPTTSSTRSCTSTRAWRARRPKPSTPRSPEATTRARWPASRSG